MKFYTFAATLLSSFYLQSSMADTNVELFYHTNLELPQDGWEFQPASPGICYDIWLSINDQVHSANMTGGHCVFWESAGCYGDHTNALYDIVNDFNYVCHGGWQKRISSFKCCDGVGEDWCAGEQPTCT